MDRDIYPVTLMHGCRSFRCRKVARSAQGAPIVAAERTLDGEDHFENTGKGESSATIAGAEFASVNWTYREQLHPKSKRYETKPCTTPELRTYEKH